MNKQISNNRYILKGNRAWHDFICSAISFPVFILILILIFIAALILTVSIGGSMAW